MDFVPRASLDRMAPDLVHQGVYASLLPLPLLDLGEFLDGKDPLPSPLVAVDGVQDPRNLGALLRTCDAAGVQGVLLPKRRVAPLSPVCAKTSSGALFTIPLIRVGNLSQSLMYLRKRGYGVASLALGGSTAYRDPFPAPLVVVVGEEEKGVSRPVLQQSDWKVSLPMRGKVSSLNLSVALGIFLYAQSEDSC
ncbi:MAG: Putative TRNA/rRNA methyltransferase (SpoU) [Leptospirillum sp. Group II 'C75']|uniref:Putative tRNA/rRNA methyltransferase (SpoU) n=1 Tax=Leptospirillum ferriphilum (strain ML-04) TaxID=1048260 RepID=J9ZCC6_LEPFM|nr:putative tRNA/rRNA methyltransferase (SpoU) [Leptospirillum ferriphilum ML-04]EAY56291.1 MAG: putative TRNA/rRNA methyltransferase (SpoU) [Leptospirillum rubarum]EIJ76984.1 MAG: Putative TRNA/rRNA methyltransferase (SpoU) [Leptospirillum sp. Group II 'C75']